MYQVSERHPRLAALGVATSVALITTACALLATPPLGGAGGGSPTTPTSGVLTPAGSTTLPPPAPGPASTTTTIAASPTTTTGVVPVATTPPPTVGPRLLFGQGSEADSAARTQLTTTSPIGMLTSWYNGPNDLNWITGWHTTLVPRTYSSGRALHLVVWTGDPEVPLNTAYGPACGRSYPLSDRFLGDMATLAGTFAGAAGGPPLYVTLFTEFQTYPCRDNAWAASPETTNYYRALKDQYLKAMAVFHQLAPNARVSLGWGGWQTRFDSPGTGGGRSMFGYFADVMRASDFQSFQAMQSDTNVDDIRAMTATLGAYGPVMLAHYKPDNGSGTTFTADMRAMLTDSFLADVTSKGLFAMSFMDDRNLSVDPVLQQLVAAAVRRYAR